MPVGRKRLTTGLAGLALAATIGVIPSSPAVADPSIGDVSARVDELYRQAEQASERYNEARLQLEDIRRELRLLEADQRRQDRRLGVVRDAVKDAMVRQYEGQGISAVGRVVVSDDPSSFLDQLTTMSAYDDVEDALFGQYTLESQALALRQRATERRADELAEVEAQLADEKAEIDAKVDEAEALLADLEAAEREEVVSRSAPVRTPAPQTPDAADVPVSGRAAAAVEYALAQVGAAYSYGAAGPDAFDCSGLTMAAWAQAGVALPHSSSAQYSSGTPVASGDLAPGDLVFYYSPISHVGLYIGNGMVVHAANPSTGVLVSPVFSMPFSGAVRPG